MIGVDTHIWIWLVDKYFIISNCENIYVKYCYKLAGRYE